MAEDKIVNLNVGGVNYKTCLVTLAKYPKSMLAATSKLKNDEDGSFFIDRDGELFRYILNYLRNGELLCSKEMLSTLRGQLLAEAKFYRLEGLINELCPLPKVFSESSIITSRDDENILLSWIWDQPRDAKWSLLYKATKDGWDPAIFHKKCDGKSPTLVVIKSGENVFGGYADKPWSSPEEFELIPSIGSFLFSLNNSFGLAPEKMFPSPPWPQTDDPAGGGIKNKASVGPSFGESGNVNNLATLLGNSKRIGIVDVQGGYRTMHEKKAYMAGAVKFVTHELEVFGLKQ